MKGVGFLYCKKTEYSLQSPWHVWNLKPVGKNESYLFSACHFRNIYRMYNIYIHSIFCTNSSHLETALISTRIQYQFLFLNIFCLSIRKPNCCKFVICTRQLIYFSLRNKGAGTLVDVLQLSYSFHQNWSKLGTAITKDHKNW
jgi:hypothetical protein